MKHAHEPGSAHHAVANAGHTTNHHANAGVRVNKFLRTAGYQMGGRVKTDPVEAVHKHEKHLHKGEPETKFRDGGLVEGVRSSTSRLDKFARGGTVRGEDNPGDSPHGNRPAPKMTAGALSGEGRLQKGRAYGAKRKG